MRKKLLCVLLCGLLLVMTGCGGETEGESGSPQGGGAGAEGSAGSGSSAGDAEEKEQESQSIPPSSGDVVIRTAEDLAEFRDRVNQGETDLDAVLGADIDLSGMCSAEAGSWTPIDKYTGNFDGGGYRISNLYIAAGSEGKVGLFTSAEKGSVIQNLTVENVYIEGGDSTGGLVNSTYGSLLNCQVSGTVKGNKTVGGIAGAIYNAGKEADTQNVIADCVNSAQVSCDMAARNAYAGGIAGYTQQHVTGCVNHGDVLTATGFAGGIIGRLEGTYYESADRMVRIEECTNNGTVDGTLYTGGIVGFVTDGFLGNCKNTGNVLGYTYLGGICGVLGGDVERGPGEYSSMLVNCVNTGNVQMHHLQRNGYIKFENTRGADYIYSEQYAGGITTSAAGGIIVNCRNAGDIICDTEKFKAECGAVHIGAWLGGRHNLVLNCISTGKITPPSIDEQFMPNGATVVGQQDPSGMSAAIFYTGEQCYDEIAPTDFAALTDGSVLSTLNAFPAEIPQELLDNLDGTGITYGVCGWKQGADGPVLEWEE